MAQPKVTTAISIRQPYAEFILTGLKTIEYRTKLTKFRGPVWIYVSKTFAGYDLPDRYLDAMAEMENDPEDLPRGVIVGSVEIVDCRQGEDGQYEYVLENPKRLRVPIVPKGTPQPGFWNPILDASK